MAVPAAVVKVGSVPPPTATELQQTGHWSGKLALTPVPFKAPAKSKEMLPAAIDVAAVDPVYFTAVPPEI